MLITSIVVYRLLHLTFKKTNKKLASDSLNWQIFWYKIVHIQPFESSWCFKASFYIPENRLNSYTSRGFRMNISMKLVDHDNFLCFFTHIKSSSSTTRRELRQQFAACSGWRWQWWIQAWKGYRVFYPLEVVDRGSETQPQVGKKLNVQLSASMVNMRLLKVKG